MLQFRVILNPFHFVRDNLLDFLLDPVIIRLYFFLHPVVSVPVPEIYNLGQLLIVACFPLHLLVIHHNLAMEYFLGGIRLSICVLIEVDLSFRLIVMLCRFCNTFPKRSESVFAVSETT